VNPVSGKTMTTNEQPLVSVVTPVYNGADFLAECIESVLSQTYRNFEYLIVNNCSKDRTLEIALSYAKTDSRIQVHDNQEFLPVIANHNHAFRLISPLAKYCKVVSGDDYIFPNCLEQMVELAEANPSIGIVGSYQQSGKRVRWQGFRYPRTVLPGDDVCRETFLTEQADFGFGSPTSILYRADLLRNSKEFYPNPSPHSDTSACFKELQSCDFGFVYQVLSYERTHEETQSFRSAQMNRYLSAGLNDLLQYGPAYLRKDEFDRLVAESLKTYHRFLAIHFFSGSQGDEFWSYHRGRLRELGCPLKRSQLFRAAMGIVLQEGLNPGQTMKKVWKRVFSKTADSGSRAVAAKIPSGS
jgi:glycosyltransferase involved in cell wall biosynthesis